MIVPKHCILTGQQVLWLALSSESPEEAMGLYLEDSLGLAQWKLNKALDEKGRFKIRPIITNELFFGNGN